MTENKELKVAEKQAIEKSHGEPTREGVFFVPQVDIFEDNDAITLRADLPGVRRENVDIDVRDGILALTASVDKLHENWRPAYTEYEMGGYARRFTLGDRIDQSKIQASMENGVLTLVLTKAEMHRPRKVLIQ